MIAAAFPLFLLALPLSIAAMNSAAALLTLAVGREAWRRRLLPWDREGLLCAGAVALYCGCGLLAAALSPEPSRSFAAAAKDLHKLWITLLVLAAVKLRPEEKAERPLALAFTALSVVGLYQVAFIRVDWPQLTRAHAWVHPVTYGEQLALGFLGGLCFLRAKPARAYALLTAAALFLSQTRAALLGAAAGAGAVALASPKLRRWLPIAALAGVAALAALEMAPSITGGRTLSSVFGEMTTLRMQAGKVVHPNQARRVLWHVALEMFQDRPLAGIGPGRYRSLFPTYFEGRMAENVWGSAHNLYLHQLAERGLLGAVGLVAVFGALGLRAWRRAKSAPGPWSHLGLAAWAAFAVMNMTENAFQNEQMAALALTIWALGERDAA